MDFSGDDDKTVPNYPFDAFKDEDTVPEVDFSLIEQIKAPVPTISVPGRKPVTCELNGTTTRPIIRITGITRECVGNFYGRCVQGGGISFENFELLSRLACKTHNILVQLEADGRTTAIRPVFSCNFRAGPFFVLQTVVREIMDALGSKPVDEKCDLIVTIS